MSNIHTVKIKSTSWKTHDVSRIVTEKPANFNFVPGQAANISLNKEEWKDKKRPFTFTSLPEDEFLEFMIKIYPSHNGVTEQISKLNAGDELILHDVWGSINYEGEGTFIAGGAGITPFMSILRHLHSEKRMNDNRLLFANKTSKDIICQKELEEILGDNFINILSEEEVDNYEKGFVTREILEKYMPDKNKYVYVCGPPPMMKSVLSDLDSLNVKKDHIVKEEF